MCSITYDTHAQKTHTLLHRAHHKYAFGLSWFRKHIKCHFLYFHFTFIGNCVVVTRNRKWEIISFMKSCSVCATLSTWARGDKRMTNVGVDGGKWSSGAAQKGDGTVTEWRDEGREGCFFIRPFLLQSPRQHACRALKKRHHHQLEKQKTATGRQRVSESKLNRPVV